MHKAHELNDNLEKKIFKIILKFGIVISFLNILINYFVGSSWFISAKWIFILILSAAVFNLIEKDLLDFMKLKLSFYLFLIYIFLPLSWFQSGGSDNSSLAYIFLALISITFLFKKTKPRNLLFLSLNAVFIILFIIEYFYPELILRYSPKVMFIDRLIQMPLILTASYLLLLQFARAYNQEKNKLGLTTKKLRLANQKLKNLANRDPLTHKFNRRAFDHEVKNIFNSQLHFKKNITLILFDIDDFKEINDSYGHDIGDQVLIKLADELEKTMPQATLISRWGGDEYAIVCYKDEIEAQKYLDQYYQNVEKLSEKMDIPITVSAGLSRFKKDDQMQKLFKRVDDILYQSKEEGKDRYTVA